MKFATDLGGGLAPCLAFWGLASAGCPDAAAGTARAQHHRVRDRRGTRYPDASHRRQGDGDLYRAGKRRNGELRFSSRPQGHQDHRRCRQASDRGALGRRHHSRRPIRCVRQGTDLSLDVRLRRRDHRQRGRPGGRAEAGRHPGADHLPAVRGALVPDDRLHDRPLHRGAAHQGSAGDARVRQRQHRGVAVRSR